MIVKGCMNNQDKIKKDLALILSVIERSLAAIFPMNHEQFSCISDFENILLVTSKQSCKSISKEKQIHT